MNKTFLRQLSTSLFVGLAIISMASASAGMEEEFFDDGDGSQSRPHKIYHCTVIKKSGNYVLGRNLDLSRHHFAETVDSAEDGDKQKACITIEADNVDLNLKHRKIKGSYDPDHAAKGFFPRHKYDAAIQISGFNAEVHNERDLSALGDHGDKEQISNFKYGVIVGDEDHDSELAPPPFRPLNAEVEELIISKTQTGVLLNAGGNDINGNTINKSQTAIQVRSNDNDVDDNILTELGTGILVGDQYYGETSVNDLGDIGGNSFTYNDISAVDDAFFITTTLTIPPTSDDVAPPKPIAFNDYMFNIVQEVGSGFRLINATGHDIDKNFVSGASARGSALELLFTVPPADLGAGPGIILNRVMGNAFLGNDGNAIELQDTAGTDVAFNVAWDNGGYNILDSNGACATGPGDFATENVFLDNQVDLGTFADPKVIPSCAEGV